MSYYNTTHERGQLLLDFSRAAASQDSLVMQVFRTYRTALTPSEVHRILQQHRMIAVTTPLVSIRRSITNMTRAEHLTKMPLKKIGPYGRPEYTWTLNAN